MISWLLLDVALPTSPAASETCLWFPILSDLTLTEPSIPMASQLHIWLAGWELWPWESLSSHLANSHHSSSTVFSDGPLLSPGGPHTSLEQLEHQR